MISSRHWQKYSFIEMEGELALAGIKEGAKWTHIDFRNPCIGIDFGTTLSGRVTDDGLPYANVMRFLPRKLHFN